MRFNEKLQFKLRNFLYEQNRKKATKAPTAESTITNEKIQKGMSTLDEMDAYIGEKVKNLNIPKIKKNE